MRNGQRGKACSSPSGNQGHTSGFTQTLLLGFEPALEPALNGIGSLDVPSPLTCEICDDFVTERSEPFLERWFGTLLLCHP